MAERIVNADLTPEILRNGGDVAQNDPETYLTSHGDDVDAAGTPSEWSEDDWTGGCAEVQQALWGFYPEWFESVKAEIRDAMEEDTQAMQKFDYDTGTFVSWDASGGRATGQIVDRTDDGQFSQAISGDITVEGTEEDPAYLIEVYEGSGDDAEPIEEDSGRGDTMHVAHRESELREVDDPRGQAASKGGVFAWLWKRFGARGSDDGTAPEAPDTSTKATGGDPSDDTAELALKKLEKELTPEQTEIVANAAEEFVAAHGNASVGEFREWVWEMEWADELNPDEIVALGSAFEDWYDEMAADAQIVTEGFADWVAEQSDGEIELYKYAPAGDTADGPMSDDDTTKDEPPEWATDLTEKVESIENRVAEIEGDGDAEKSLEDAPEWANDLAEKVDDLDERVEAVATQSGHSQQLGKTEEGEETEKTNGFTLDPRKAG